MALQRDHLEKAMSSITDAEVLRKVIKDVTMACLQDSQDYCMSLDSAEIKRLLDNGELQRVQRLRAEESLDKQLQAALIKYGVIEDTSMDRIDILGTMLNTSWILNIPMEKMILSYGGALVLLRIRKTDADLEIFLNDTDYDRLIKQGFQVNTSDAGVSIMFSPFIRFFRMPTPAPATVVVEGITIVSPKELHAHYELMLTDQSTAEALADYIAKHPVN